jgi:hypothetical protein
LIGFLFQPGFSTKAISSAYSGRGIGLDVVQSTVERLGGQIEVAKQTLDDSMNDLVARFYLRFPLHKCALLVQPFFKQGQWIGLLPQNIKKVVSSASEVLVYCTNSEVKTFENLLPPTRILISEAFFPQRSIGVEDQTTIVLGAGFHEGLDQDILVFETI